MNLNFDLSAFSRAFRGFAAELRKNRPLAGGIAVLVLALVAIPVLLSKSASPAPVPPAPLPSTAPVAGATIPTLNVATSPADSRLAGPARNPFGNSTGTATSTAPSTSASRIVAIQTPTSTATSTSFGGTTSTLTSTSNTSSSGGSSSPSSSGTSSAPASSPTPATPTKPKPAPTGLASNQAYDVSTAITNGNGGLNTIDPLERLSVLPSDRQPLLIELGVAQNGDHVLFAARRDAILSGPGTCIPGPIDCEILSLGTNRTESIATGTGSATPTVVALFEVTGISKQSYSSSAAADKARQAHSAVGQALLAKSNLTALSLFRYEPAVGAVVDQRDLSVGR